MPSDIDAARVALTTAIGLALDVCDAHDSGPLPGRTIRAGLNMPELLRDALEDVARERGGTDALVIHRPGSWEAQHVRALASGADF